MSPRKHFGMTKINLDVHKMISRLENSAMAVATAQTPEEIDDAYTILCLDRKIFYEYLEDELEIPEGTPLAYLRFT